jgi:hypothetical protein
VAAIRRFRKREQAPALQNYALLKLAALMPPIPLHQGNAILKFPHHPETKPPPSPVASQAYGVVA